MIEIRNLTKTYGAVTAVDDLTVTIRPGRVTGDNPARPGDRLSRPERGGQVDHDARDRRPRPPGRRRRAGRGRRYADHPAPLHTVGALLDARAFHPGRSARAHLRARAATNGIGRHRVDEVLDPVGVRDVADRRAGGFSLGMGQRLGIAAALLGDPEVVLLDEPVNGLDPDGVRWIRDLFRRLAGEGRTVFVSSHLMSEMARTADHLVVLGRGRLLADVSLAELTARADGRVPPAQHRRRAGGLYVFLFLRSRSAWWCRRPCRATPAPRSCRSGPSSCRRGRASRSAWRTPRLPWWPARPPSSAATRGIRRRNSHDRIDGCGMCRWSSGLGKNVHDGPRPSSPPASRDHPATGRRKSSQPRRLRQWPSSSREAANSDLRSTRSCHMRDALASSSHHVLTNGAPRGR